MTAAAAGNVAKYIKNASRRERRAAARAAAGSS
jgi:hypothetical protein